MVDQEEVLRVTAKKIFELEGVRTAHVARLLTGMGENMRFTRYHTSTVNRMTLTQMIATGQLPGDIQVNNDATDKPIESQAEAIFAYHTEYAVAAACRSNNARWSLTWPCPPYEELGLVRLPATEANLYMPGSYALGGLEDLLWTEMNAYRLWDIYSLGVDVPLSIRQKAAQSFRGLMRATGTSRDRYKQGALWLKLCTEQDVRKLGADLYHSSSRLNALLTTIPGAPADWFAKGLNTLGSMSPDRVSEILPFMSRAPTSRELAGKSFAVGLLHRLPWDLLSKVEESERQALKGLGLVALGAEDPRKVRDFLLPHKGRAHLQVKEDQIMGLPLTEDGWRRMARIIFTHWKTMREVREKVVELVPDELMRWLFWHNQITKDGWSELLRLHPKSDEIFSLTRRYKHYTSGVELLTAYLPDEGAAVPA